MAENWSDGNFESQTPAAPRGFPSNVPEWEIPPEFEWIQRNARSARERRLDYNKSITPFTPIMDKRQPGLGKKNIDNDIYLRRQDEENRKACRF